MKLSADRDGSLRFFSAKLGWGEHFDSRELEMLFAGAVPRLISPAVVQGKKNNVLRFNISAYATLDFQLSCVLSREQFADLLLQCTEIFRQMQRVYLNYKNLVFDLDKIYVQMEDRSVHFIYLPLINSKREAAIPDFFKTMVMRASRSTYEQMSFLEGCQAYLQRPVPFSLEEFDAFIRGSIGGAAPAPAPVLAGAVLAGQPAVFTPAPVADSRIYQPVAQAHMFQSTPPVQGGTARLDVPAEGGTTLLGGPETPPPPTVRFYLVRTQTGERIEITHTPFLLGTELGTVSYCVTNNTAVSRRHALFAIESGVCTVTDQKSTNKTYLNDQVLTPNLPAAVKDGDQLRLGNESFTFHEEA